MLIQSLLQKYHRMQTSIAGCHISFCLRTHQRIHVAVQSSCRRRCLKSFSPRIIYRYMVDFQSLCRDINVFIRIFTSFFPFVKYLWMHVDFQRLFAEISMDTCALTVPSASARPPCVTASSIVQVDEKNWTVVSIE